MLKTSRRFENLDASQYSRFKIMKYSSWRTIPIGVCSFDIDVVNSLPSSPILILAGIKTHKRTCRHGLALSDSYDELLVFADLHGISLSSNDICDADDTHYDIRYGDILC